ncbi:putative toxin-antitoxin system toxin component, PIN family [Aphanothece sacrum]|uniref:DNA-binding protein n=1 Tax=Aphanothece sacrum FPU1 TaxID=1920663 RepID=A0A401IJB2_APHSA|nr:putative toxin-antitoxin system toxin component, PIN family [Aphanothece sacrum]GBF81349.1 DNA-binding protein [Aphanothece sacrum FPU1]GBF86129.1 DNA-binding protein [Aphanothece sacrum FPU3]
MVRFVLDTNVIVSSLLFSQSIPRQAVNKALDTGKILISQEIIRELTKVLNRKKLNKYLLQEERMKFLADFLKDAETVTITQNFDVCRDKKDNKFIDLAVCGKAQYIITGDQDLLTLNPFSEIYIINSRQFLNQ